MEIEALWKEQRNFNVLIFRSREDEACDNRVLKQKRLYSSPSTIHHRFHLGWWQNSESDETRALSPQFIYISNQVALTGEKGIPGEEM